MNDKYKAFRQECSDEVKAQGRNEKLVQHSRDWVREANAAKYSYHFEWMGRPIIQYPQDIMAMQELIFKIQPDLIIETGIAHGGSVIFSASMLELNAISGGPQDAMVVAVDIDIRQHNREAIAAHSMSKRITMIQGSSIDPAIVEKVKAHAKGKKRVLISLDSNHTHEHVLEELKAYAPLTSVGSYCVVFDTIVEDLPAGTHPDRPWNVGNNPKTAVWEYLKSHPEFEIDKEMDNKLLISVAPDGFLKRVR
jgi:cephalosporin hydroxylase